MGRVKFMCDAHYEMYREFMEKPMRGLDPMVPNDEYFKPSLFEVIRHGLIAVAFEDRNKRPMQDYSLMRATDKDRYSSAQLPQALALRRALLEQKRGS